MHRECATQRLRTRFRQAEIPDLPLLHKPCHRADRLLDGRVRVYSMLVVEVDRFHSQTLETGFTCRANIVGPPVDAPACGVFTPNDPELSCNDGLFAPSLDCPADQLFVGERPVHVRRVQEV